MYIDTGLGSLIKGTDSMVKVNITFEVYGHFLIVRVPDDRMYSNILMFSGDPDDVGQEAGGYAPDYNNSGFANIAMMAIPIEAAFTNTRYMVDNFLYPAFLQTNPYTSVDIRELNQRMYGNVEINNAGINQKANAFEYDIRAIYGGSLFDNRARNCFAITGPVGAVNVPTTGIKVTGAGGNKTVAVDGTLLMTASVLPADATNKNVVWSVVAGTGTAEISPAGLLTGKTAGTVTVKATQGSIVGELVVTVTG